MPIVIGMIYLWIAGGIAGGLWWLAGVITNEEPGGWGIIIIGLLGLFWGWWIPGLFQLIGKMFTKSD